MKQPAYIQIIYSRPKLSLLLIFVILIFLFVFYQIFLLFSPPIRTFSEELTKSGLEKIFSLPKITSLQELTPTPKIQSPKLEFTKIQQLSNKEVKEKLNAVANDELKELINKGEISAEMMRELLFVLGNK